MFWYNYFMDDVFAHLVFYILFKKIGEMIDSVVLISQGPSCSLQPPSRTGNVAGHSPHGSKCHQKNGQKNTGSPLFYWVSGNRGDGIRTHDLCVPKIINNAEILEKQGIYRVEIKKSFPLSFLNTVFL